MESQLKATYRLFYDFIYAKIDPNIANDLENMPLFKLEWSSLTTLKSKIVVCSGFMIRMFMIFQKNGYQLEPLTHEANDPSLNLLRY